MCSGKAQNRLLPSAKQPNKERMNTATNDPRYSAHSLAIHYAIICAEMMVRMATTRGVLLYIVL